MNCIFIYNPNSGSSKNIVKNLDYIKEKLSTKYDVVDIVPTQYATHATKIANEACGVYDCLVLAGGDGTFNEVINGLAGNEVKPVVGYVPCGTVCDMANNLGMTKNVKNILPNSRKIEEILKNHESFVGAKNRGTLYIKDTKEFFTAITAYYYEIKE